MNLKTTWKQLQVGGDPLASTVCDFILRRAAVLAFAVFASGQARADLVVERIGDANRVLGSDSTPVFLEFFSTDGTRLRQPVALAHTNPRPITAPFNLMDSGTATSDGQLTRSVDGRFLQVPGYNGTNGEAHITSSFADFVGRTIGLVDSSGGVSATRSLVMFDADNFRSVVSLYGTRCWAAGAPGIAYVNGTNVTYLTGNSTKVVNIFNYRLYCSRAGGSPGIYAVGTGLPTTPPVSQTRVIPLPGTASPFAFQMDAAQKVCYIADDNSTNGGIMKYTLSGGVWTFNYTLSVGAGVGARGLTVDWSRPSVPVLYATTGEDAANRLVRIADAGAGSSPTTLATAALRTVYRGVDFLPMPAVWRPASSGNWSAGGNNPWSNWTICFANWINLSFQNVNSGTAALALSLTNNTSITDLNSIRFTAVGYGESAAGTSYSLYGSSLNLLSGIHSDSPARQTINIPLTLTADQTFETASGDLVIDSVLSGSASLRKAGAAALILNAANHFTGSLTIAEGTLEINGTLTNSFLDIAGGTLRGAGKIYGPVLIGGNGTLSPGGNAIAKLRVNGPLTLSGAVTIQLNKTGTNLSCDTITGITMVNCGGTLNVTGSGGNLAAGDSFQVFQADSYSGGFAALNLPPLESGLYWDSATLASSGALRVERIVPPSVQPPSLLWDGTVLLYFSGSPGATYRVWATPDLSWTPIEATWQEFPSGQFDATGEAFLYDPYAPWYPQRFYVISVP